MAALHSLRLRIRLLVLMVVLVAFDVVAVAAAYVLAHVAAGIAPLLAYQYEHLFWSMGFDIVPLWPVLLIGTPIVLICQSLFGYRLTVQDTNAHAIRDPTPNTVAEMRDRIERHDTVQQLRSRVDRLAHVANMTAPSVAVVESATPNSYVSSRPGEQTLVATTGLLTQLDEAELDAVLSHELAHLKNGDAFVMTAAAFLPTVSRRFITALTTYFSRSWVGRRLFGTDKHTDDDNSGSWGWNGQFAIAITLFALVALPLTAVLYLTSAACYRCLSRIREYAADAGGVAICGSPAAFASALEQLTEDPRPDTDARTAEVGVRELCVVPHTITDTQSEPPANRFDRLAHRCRTVTERILPNSHPDPDTRIAALQERYPGSGNRTEW